MSWAWEQDSVEKLPRFPEPMPQRDVAGRHYLMKSDLNALYFATYRLPRPRGWRQPFTVGHYWHAALVVFFNYGVDYAEFRITSTRGPCSSRRVFTSPFFGATCVGVANIRTAAVPSPHESSGLLAFEEHPTGGASTGSTRFRMW